MSVVGPSLRLPSRPSSALAIGRAAAAPLARPSSAIASVSAASAEPPAAPRGEPILEGTTGGARMPAACRCWEGRPLSAAPSPRLREAVTSRPQSGRMHGRVCRMPSSPQPAAPASPASPHLPVQLMPAQLAAQLQGPGCSPFCARHPLSPCLAAALATASSRPASARAALPHKRAAGGASPRTPPLRAATRRWLPGPSPGSPGHATPSPPPGHGGGSCGCAGYGSLLQQQLDLLQRPPGLGGACTGIAAQSFGLATKAYKPRARAPPPSRPASAVAARPARGAPSEAGAEAGAALLHVAPAELPAAPRSANCAIQCPPPTELPHSYRRPATEPPRHARRAKPVEPLHMALLEVGPWACDDKATRPCGGPGVRLAAGSPLSTSSSPLTVPRPSSPVSFSSGSGRAGGGW